MGSIRVSNIGKAYKQYPSRWSRLAEWTIPFSKPRHTLKWTLRGISFEVVPGESIGIIGLNGAGKSTLLKIITGTTQPTTGNVELSGRVAALLELGMGFHPDFSGRQNVLMAGQLLGLSVGEIKSLMPEIEDFAEIGDYMDQPVRIYSSGMMVRVAFSIATAVRPDILIVDEALSVGDTYFQHKSFDRIRKFREEGTTLLFVSHSAGSIKTLCDRALLLDEGVIQRDGDPESVMDYYNAMIAKQEADYQIRQSGDGCGNTITVSGTFEVEIEEVELFCNDQSVRAIISGEAVTFRVLAKANTSVEELTVGILLKDRLGNDVFGTNTFHHGVSKEHIGIGERFIVDYYFPELRLGQGSYSVTIALHSRDVHVIHNYEWRDRALVFQVIPSNTPLFIGVCDFPVRVRCYDAPMQDTLDNGLINARIEEPVQPVFEFSNISIGKYPDWAIGPIELEGFYGPEPWGRWTRERMAIIAFTPRETQKDLVIEFRAGAFTTEHHPNQCANIYIADRSLDYWIISHGMREVVRRIVIPANMVNSGKRLELRFEIENPKSPSSLGLGDDSRLLGLAFREMQVVR
ncbi:MAG: ABC transporter ATP-binding protein [Methylococcaceae bacterium]|nr:ABC transporter ATP-binding protein [Methylococcaceae bacterium]